MAVVQTSSPTFSVNYPRTPDLKKLSSQTLNKYRQKTFGIAPGSRVKTFQDVIDFVEERKFIFFWPVKGILLPSLWVANAGDRDVPMDHDDAGHRTWGWKDDALGKKLWYYAKFLRHRATFVSLDMIPNFYALSPNYGDPLQDYMMQYEEGKFTQECKLIYEALIKEGALDTLSLKKAARLSNKTAELRFNKATEHLQAELKILPIGIAEVGAWKYAYIYDLTHRHFPWLIEKAGGITEHTARETIVEAYFRSIGAVQSKELSKLFQWSATMIEKILDRLIEKGVVSGEQEIENLQGRFFVLNELFS